MKKGFSLVEILAITSIIALMVAFALPSVLKIYVESEKKSFKSEMQNLVRAAEIGYGNTSLNTLYITDTTYQFIDGEESVLNGNISIEISGNRPQNGTLTITSQGEISFNIHNGKYCATKLSGSKEITVQEKTLNECIPQ